VAIDTAKLLDVASARRMVDEARGDGRRVVFANGCFDLLHGGHISYIEGARALGDLLIIGLNSDASVRRLKGEGRPVVPEGDRAELLAGLAAVDGVIIFGEDDVNGLLEALLPHVHAKGTDYTVETVPERETALRLGIETAIAGAAKQNDSRAIIGGMASAPPPDQET
jgi:D-glycero-beta-D-manno-heptose 1-phosphate adenylyltransferase